jgi:outer membrane lipoprotein carrier protein
MRRWLIPLLVLAFVTPGLVGAGDTENVIAKIRARYGKAKDFTADFDQVTTLVQLGGQKKTATGTLAIARPNKMHWVYKTPTRKEIISDGATLAVYYVDEKKVYLSSTQATYDISTPVRLLSGEVNVSEVFTPELLPDADGRARLKLTPKKPAGYKFMILHWSREKQLIDILETEDDYGNRTVMNLSNQKFNVGLPDSYFSYTPIPGVQIIEAPMMDLH